MKMSICSGCLLVYRPETPIHKCSCGYINMGRKRKYIIDFTMEKNGHFPVYATSEEEAGNNFKAWIRKHRQETEQFIGHLTFDTDIKFNYAYEDKHT